MTEQADFRRMPIADAVRWLAEHGEPADPRTVSSAPAERAATSRSGTRDSGAVSFNPTSPAPHG